ERGILYQGFSLLTANQAELQHPAFRRLAARVGRTPAQVVFRFALQVGMQPLTGTTDPAHMREDLQGFEFELSGADVRLIEGLAGSCPDSAARPRPGSGPVAGARDAPRRERAPAPPAPRTPARFTTPRESADPNPVPGRPPGRGAADALSSRACGRRGMGPPPGRERCSRFRAPPGARSPRVHGTEEAA